MDERENVGDDEIPGARRRGGGPDDDPRRTAADELARRLATPEGLAEARRRQGRGEYPGLEPPHPPGHEPAAPSASGPTPDPAPAEGPAGPAPAAAPRPISIWRPRREESSEESSEEPARVAAVDGPVWVRPAPSPLGDHYAARREIRARKEPGVRRVAFFGESAAAGYLYAPHLTPAGVLQARLDALCAGGAFPSAVQRWEVVDLARTNERCATLAATVEAAAQLAPDHLVVFTGNNPALLETPHLAPDAPSVTARQALAACLAGADEAVGRAVEAARAARRGMAEALGHALERLAAVARETGAAVTLVLPEVNLDDWETREPPVLLPADGNARWFALHGRAHAALAARDGRRAEARAWEMVELDGGTGPTPFRLLARALQGRAAVEAERDALLAAARDAARSEIDATHPPLLASVAAPRAGEAVHRILSGAARRHGFATVDLRRVFADWTASPLPGRRLFLDYCHFTAEGMDVAMAAVAHALLGWEGAAVAAGGWRSLAQDRLAAPTAAARATAHLGAAVHTAHRHLPVTGEGGLHRGLLEHHARAALEADPAGAAAAMLDLADVRSAALPELLTAAHRRNLSRPAPLLLQHGWRWPHLDGGLLRALAAVLAERGQRREVEEMGRLLLGRRRVPSGDGGLELVHPPHALTEPAGRFVADATAAEGLAPRALLRLPWPEVAFDLVVEPGARLEVAAVLRRPGATAARAAASAGTVEVRLDGRPVGKLAAGPSWTRSRLELEVSPGLAPEVLAAPASPGSPSGLPLRRLTLRWPPPPPAGPDPLAAAAARLELGRATPLHPVCGEIASLRVRSQ